MTLFPGSFLSLSLSRRETHFSISLFLSSFELPRLQVCIPLPPYAIRSGPRKTIFADPSATTAAIVTCGGLCPGKERKRALGGSRRDKLEKETQKTHLFFPQNLSPSSKKIKKTPRRQGSMTSSRTLSSPSPTTASLPTRSWASGTASAASTLPGGGPSAAGGSRSSSRERRFRGSTFAAGRCWGRRGEGLTCPRSCGGCPCGVSEGGRG